MGATLQHVAWSPDSSRFAIALDQSSFSTVEVYESQNAELLWRANSPGYVLSMEYSSDGRMLAVVHYGGYPLQIRDAETGFLDFEYEGTDSCFPMGLDVEFSPDSGTLYWTVSGGRSAEYRSSVYRVDLSTGYCGSRFKFIQGFLTTFYIMDQGNRLVTTVEDTSKYTLEDWVYIWDAADGDLLCSFRGVAPAGSETDNLFILQADDQQLAVIDAVTCKEKYRFTLDGDVLDFAPALSLILVGSTSRFVVYDYESGITLNQLPFPPDAVYPLTSPDWKHVIFRRIGVDPYVRLYSAR